MLRHLQLIDPIERTRDMNVSEFAKYINMRNAQTSPTDLNIVKEIQRQFFETHSTDESQAALEIVWKAVSTKVQLNAGLANFILDYNLAKSQFFFPWLINVFRSPSLALEMAYGAGPDLEGNWTNLILPSDPMDMFVRNDPTFVYNRERQLYVADLATTIQEHKSKIVDFSAGRMAWARWHNFDFKPEHQSILAYDKDPSVNPEDLFPGQDMARLGIEFKRGNLMAQVNSPECINTDLAIVVGVAAYIPVEVFAQAILMPVYHLLNPNGVIFFDLQVDCPYFRRNMSIFDWPKMYLAADVEDGIKKVEGMRRKLWGNGRKLSVEYAIDSYNEIPLAVMVTMQKI